MRVFVYWNLHKKVWSIKALEGTDKGRVIAHADYVELANVKFKVSEAGRQRVLREKRKNVHAGAVGVLESWSNSKGEYLYTGRTLYSQELLTEAVAEMVSYNPYKGSTFYSKDTGASVRHARSAFLVPDRRVFTYGAA